MWREAASSIIWIGRDVRGGSQPARALAGCDSGSGGFGGDDGNLCGGVPMRSIISDLLGLSSPAGPSSSENERHLMIRSFGRIFRECRRFPVPACPTKDVKWVVRHKVSNYVRKRRHVCSNAGQDACPDQNLRNAPKGRIRAA